MNKKLLGAIIIVIGLVSLALFKFGASSLVVDKTGKTTFSDDYKNATYTIEGKEVKLIDGVSETPATSDSASVVTTKYFGNELVADLDGDGREDVAFIVTQDSGGSGTFFYGVVALNTPQGYVGSEGYLLGDRIAPQNTNLSSDEIHRHVVIFNYAERLPGEPMTARPSVAKSVYVKIDPDTMRWAIVLSPDERAGL